MPYTLTFNSKGDPICHNTYMGNLPETLPSGEVIITDSQAFLPASSFQLVNGKVVESLTAAKSEQIALLKAGYLNAINAPVTFKNAAGVTSTYPSGNTILITGDKAKSLLAETISAGSAAWTLGKWLDTNDVAQTFTFADLQGLAAAMESAVTASYETLVSKIAQVNAATTVADVQAVTW